MTDIYISAIGPEELSPRNFRLGIPTCARMAPGDRSISGYILVHGLNYQRMVGLEQVSKRALPFSGMGGWSPSSLLT